MEKKVGRPRLFETPEDLQVAIDAYFDALDGEHPTVTGLNYALGFATRNGLWEYKSYDGFSDTVKRALMRVEAALEQNLYGGQVTGTIFNLKNNFGWQDRQVQELDVPEETKKALWGG